MKNIIKLIAITALVAVIGFSFITCDDGNNNNGDGDTVISIKAIAGVTAPVQGETPVTAITANAQYTGKVAWSDTPATFAYATEYVATITLTAKSGYTLQGVSADFFTVAEAIAVNNAANSGVVTAIFPQTVDDPSLDHLSGDITINPDTGVTIGTELTATYSGSEAVSFQWEKDGVNVGTASTTNPNKYTPTVAGEYTVTVSAAGYNPKTCAPVNVTSGGDPLHVHDWNTTYTTITAATETSNGTEAQTCKHNVSHTQNSRIQYATGTTGLAFDLIDNGTAYRVHNGGNRTFAAVHIPAFHRANADSPYLPVTEIGNGTNLASNNAFGGTIIDSVTTANEALTTVTFAAENQLKIIGGGAFLYCTSITSITILDSVTIGAGVQSIGQYAFMGCNILTSVTFQGTIPSSGFHVDAFLTAYIGYLRDTFYSNDPTNGTPGTYRRSSYSSTTWTLQ